MKKKEMIFSLGIVNKLKTMLIQFFLGGGGANKVYCGRCENGEFIEMNEMENCCSNTDLQWLGTLYQNQLNPQKTTIVLKTNFVIFLHLLTKFLSINWQ